MNPRNIKVVGNTVIVNSGYACMRANGWTTANSATYLIANNAFFCEAGVRARDCDLV